MKLKLATTLMVLASQLFITPVFAICIWNFGNTCTKQDITNTATNKVTATVNSGSDSKSTAKVDIGETKINADIIKQFIGSQDANQLFVPLVNQSTKQIENTNQIFKEFQTTIKDINKSNQELLKSQAEENRKWSETIIKQVIASPPTIPIVSGSSSFPIILPTNSQTTPIYINEVNQQLTNTLNNLNTTLSNMSIPLAGASVTNIPNGPGSTLAPVAIADLPTGGNIGTAATTVDVNSAFVITQTTASQTITLPSPTAPTGSRLVTVQSGSGSTASFTIYGETLSASQAVDLLWNGTAWVNASGGDPTTQNLTYGRVNAAANLASKSFVFTGVGSTIDFTATVYSSGMTFSGTNGITPSVAGRYRAGWYINAGSDETANNATIVVVQGGVSLGSVYINQHNSAGSVNQSAGFIDVNVAAGVPVFLHYQPDATELVAFDRGSYFQLSELPIAVAPVVNTVAEYGEQVLGSSVLISNTSTNSGNATDIMSFTIPSAGVWDIDYTIRGVKNETNADNVVRMVAIITNNSNSVITNSELMVGGQRGGSTSGLANDLQASGAMRLRVTTTGATTYKVRGFNDGSSGAFTWTAVSDGNGKTKVSWNKIEGQTSASAFTGANGTVAGTVGFVPAPAATDNVKFLKGDGTWGTVTATLTSGQNLGIVDNSVTSSSSFVDIPGSSFTLPAAGTWMVTYDVQGTNSGLANAWGNIRVTTSANVFVTGSQSELMSRSAISEIQSVSKTVLVTTTGSAVYKLQYATQGGNFTIYNNALLNGGGNSNITWIKVN